MSMYNHTTANLTTSQGLCPVRAPYSRCPKTEWRLLIRHALQLATLEPFPEGERLQYLSSVRLSGLDVCWSLRARDAINVSGRDGAAELRPDLRLHQVSSTKPCELWAGAH